MGGNQNQLLAEALDVEPRVVPYIPELLADIQVMGSWPTVIVELLRPLKFREKSARILDLGCGKGAVAISMARDLGYSVKGIDLFPPFIVAAKDMARKYGVANLCRFEVGDVRAAVTHCRDYDVVVFAAIGGLFSDFSHCIARLRQTVCEGGYIVIDDGFLSHVTRLYKPGYEYYRSHAETVRQLVMHGDTLIEERVIPLEELRACNQKNTDLIRNRAATLAQRHPQHASDFASYVEWEESESEILETETTPAVWLLQRAG